MDAHGRFDDVLQNRHVRIKIELLEHHADLAALPGDAVGRKPLQPVVVHPVANLFTIHLDVTLLDGLKVVDTAQKCGLSRARRT